jgi:hypothetical protein
MLENPLTSTWGCLDLTYESKRFLQHNATSWDNGCQKPPLLTPFLTPIAPRRARNRVPSILALGPLFFF